MRKDNWGYRFITQRNNNGNWQAKHKILLLLYDYLGLKTRSYNSTPAKYI